ncbi:MAG TPA: response regulator [Gemmatimonadaceae bacterium]|nr:response regulator [Gemmatimonadaceae bacterium]
MYPHQRSGSAVPRRAPGPPTVVVADDDPVFRELLCRCIGASGCVAVGAADAMQTVMYAMQRAPSAILLDINMPGGTGIGALERLRQSVKTRDIPVIVVTGTSEPGMEEHVRALGACAYLQKPVDPVLLQATVASIIYREAVVH